MAPSDAASLLAGGPLPQDIFPPLTPSDIPGNSLKRINLLKFKLILLLIGKRQPIQIFGRLDTCELIIKILTKVHICPRRHRFQPFWVPSARIRPCSCSGTFLWQSPNHPCAGVPLRQRTRWGSVCCTQTQHSCRHRSGHGSQQPCSTRYGISRTPGFVHLMTTCVYGKCLKFI